jgi:hypothetical protein
MAVGPNDPAEGLYGVIKGLVRGPVHALLAQVFGDTAGKPVEIATLEYVDVLEYAAARRAEDRRIMATLVRRQPRADVDAWVVTQVFTDQKDALIRSAAGLTGRQLLVKAMDDELTDLFGEAESIAIELP